MEDHPFQRFFSGEEMSNSEEIDSGSAVYLDDESFLAVRGNFLTAELYPGRYAWDRITYRRHKSDWIMNRFVYKKTKNMITKENTRIMFMRSHNKAIKLIRQQKVPRDQRLKFEATDLVSRGLWNTLIEIVQEFDIRCSTEITKSMAFTDDFCREYFAEEPVRKSYFFFIEFLFVFMSPSTLCDKFGLQCCQEDTHLIYCSHHWEQFKSFVQFEFLESLGITPFKNL